MLIFGYGHYTVIKRTEVNNGFLYHEGRCIFPKAQLEGKLDLSDTRIRYLPTVKFDNCFVTNLI